MPEIDISKLKLDRSPAPDAPRRRSRKWIWITLAALLLAGSAWLAASLRAIEVETVTVTTAYPYQALTLLNATGYVVAQRKAAVSSKATGRLEWLGVREGSAVKENDIIARLESRDVSAQADQAQAQVTVAQAGIGQANADLKDADLAYRRARDLLAQKFVAQSAVDTAQARYNRALAALASAKAQLAAAQAAARAAQVAVDQTVIRAPFDGVVLTKSANVGDIVTPFSSAIDSKGAVVSMADMSTLEVEADVSESNLAKIKVGQACEIQLDALPDQRFRGEVSRLVPTVDRAKASVLTKVRFIDRDPRLLPEMSAKVAFLERAVADDERKPLTAINPDAVVDRDGQRVAFLMVEGRAKRVPVTTGAKLGDNVAVTGVAPGDKAVLKPPDSLRDGAPIRLAEKS
ncbi:MAG: efflux RND transporter periplasmic adaptor subunit [Sterolibacteriaceae bacterium]|uniref:Efflux RND transporter periplasmic adaptor subunit n=1 Tax=Candidatus Methylophosphatis roskildensis TaxID=2899263 RepID=A0A9D7E5N0_9PROT|nr:efflux RND transporter periplasmic adaptor subunit [Candidatus Methylophosphatis roskildensis]